MKTMIGKMTALFVTMVMLCACCIPMCAQAEEAALQGNAALIHETIKWHLDFPKDAQVLQAIEYLCKIEGHQLHLLLLEATQNRDIQTLYGKSAGLMLIDLETGNVITNFNCIWPETSDITTKEDALYMVFSCYLSFLEGYNPFIYSDSEIVFPIADEDIAAINEELNRYFIR